MRQIILTTILLRCADPTSYSWRLYHWGGQLARPTVYFCSTGHFSKEETIANWNNNLGTYRFLTTSPINDMEKGTRKIRIAHLAKSLVTVWKVQDTKLWWYKKNTTKSERYEVHGKRSPTTPHDNRGWHSLEKLVQESSKLYQKLAPNRAVFCSAQVTGTSFLRVCQSQWCNQCYLR